jgi:hypothetical protein
MLTVIDPKALNIVSNDRDILRDLITYLDYIIDRAARENAASSV